MAEYTANEIKNVFKLRNGDILYLPDINRAGSSYFVLFQADTDEAEISVVPYSNQNIEGQETPVVFSNTRLGIKLVNDGQFRWSEISAFTANQLGPVPYVLGVEEIGSNAATAGQVPIAQADGSVLWDDLTPPGSGAEDSIYTISPKTGVYNITTSDLGTNLALVFTIPSDTLANLPVLSASLAGKSIAIANHSTSTGNVEVTAGLGDNILGQSNFILYPGDSAKFIPFNDSTYWLVL
jgi:hypothetical protein